MVMIYDQFMVFGSTTNKNSGSLPVQVVCERSLFYFHFVQTQLSQQFAGKELRAK
jgi:hypothetical protein